MAQRRTLDQRLRAAELQASKLRNAQRQLLTRQKIIVGATILSAAGRDPALADQLDGILRQTVTGRDLDAIEPVLARLSSTPSDVLAQLAPAIEPLGAAPAADVDSTSNIQPVADASPALAGLENVSRRAARPRTL